MVLSAKSPVATRFRASPVLHLEIERMVYRIGVMTGLLFRLVRGWWAKNPKSRTCRTPWARQAEEAKLN